MMGNVAAIIMKFSALLYKEKTLFLRRLNCASFVFLPHHSSLCATTLPFRHDENGSMIIITRTNHPWCWRVTLWFSCVAVFREHAHARHQKKTHDAGCVVIGVRVRIHHRTGQKSKGVRSLIMRLAGVRLPLSDITSCPRHRVAWATHIFGAGHYIRTEDLRRFENSSRSQHVTFDYQRVN